MLRVYAYAKSGIAFKRRRQAFLAFVVGLLFALAFACGGEEGVLPSSPTPEVVALRTTPTATFTAAPSPTATATALPILEATPGPTEEPPTPPPVVGPASCDELRQALQPALGPTSEITYCDNEKKVAVEYGSKSRTWTIYLLATGTIEDWRARQKVSLEVLSELGAEPCRSFWTIVDALKPDLRPGDLDPYGCRQSTAPPTATPTAPAIDARSVPIESLLRPGAKVMKVLYASLDGTAPEEIVIYSEMTVMKGEQECGPVPFLEVFAYDAGRDQWSKVFDASGGEETLIPVQLEDYEQGPMCALIYWLGPVELMDFDGNGRQELVVRVLGGGGSGNPGDVVVLGFEGAGAELKPTRLFQAQLWKAQDVVVAGQGEVWLEQVITSKWEPVAHAAAALRGVVRYDRDEQAIAVVDQDVRLLCTEGTVTSKTEALLTLSCESPELPGLMDPYPAELDFLVDQYTRFAPTPGVSGLDDIQIGDHVQIQVATLGLSAGGIAPEWVFIDGTWTVPGAAYVGPVAAQVEVVSASSTTPVASSIFAGPGVSFQVLGAKFDGLTATIDGYVYSTNFNIPGIVWDWGDGTVDESWFPARHTYARPGRYTLTVWVYDDSGTQIAGQSSPIDLIN